MPAVTKTTIFSNPWNTIKTLIKDNVTDPKSRFKPNWVFSRLPLISKADFVGFPFIVVEPVRMTDKDKSLNQTAKGIEYTTVISVYTDDDASQLDSLSDDLINVLNSNKSTLVQNNLFHVQVQSSDSGLIVLQGKKNVFIRFITVFFETRLETA